MSTDNENGPCPKCRGCGRVANTADQEPWTFWSSLPPRSALAVTVGVVRPQPCPACKGTGKVEPPTMETTREDEAAALAERLKSAGTCGACGARGACGCGRMTFGDAIAAMKRGSKVARSGWNGKGMWLVLWGPGTYSADSELFENAPALAEYASRARSGTADVAGSIVMRAADGSLVLGWHASQTDMLAEDWAIVT